MFRNAKVGDKVFSYLLQEWGTIIDIDEEESYSIIVKFYLDEDDYTIEEYTVGGYENDFNKVPTLFWDEVKSVEVPKKSLPNLRVDTKVIVWNDGDTKYNMHFSHFDKNGNIHCFTNGNTSWTTTETQVWNNWEMQNE